MGGYDYDNDNDNDNEYEYNPVSALIRCWTLDVRCSTFISI
jgi:hypothetical protein